MGSTVHREQMGLEVAVVEAVSLTTMIITITARELLAAPAASPSGCT